MKLQNNVWINDLFKVPESPVDFTAIEYKSTLLFQIHIATKL